MRDVVCVLVAACGFVGCAPGVEGRSWRERIADAKPVPLSSMKLPNARLDKEEVQLFDLGPITVRDVGNQRPRMLTREEEVSPIETDALQLVVADASQHRAFRVDFPPTAMAERAKRRALHSRAKALDGPVDRLDEAMENMKPLGWSNGVDNRTRRNIASYGADHNRYSQIGKFGDCTASFVEGYPPNQVFILTAAHCAWDEDGPIFEKFRPRYENDYDEPASEAPFGTWRADWMVVYTGWIDDCADTDGTTSACISLDIALVRVHPESGSTNQVDPDLHRFDYGTNLPLSTGTLYHRGYPNCGFVGGPNCDPGEAILYGDGAATIGNLAGGSSAGKYKQGKTSSDASNGHSGGPFYSSYGSRGWIFGVVVATDVGCYSGCNKSRPTYVRLVDEHWEGIMDYWTWDVWH